MPITTRNLLDQYTEILQKIYGKHLKTVILYGSYARGEETDESDIDVIVVGGIDFQAKNIFAFGEELRQMTQKNVDAFEIRELERDTDFYNTVMREGVKIA